MHYTDYQNLYFKFIKREALYKKYSHPFHMVTKSSWPILISITLFNLVLSFIAKVNLAFSTSIIENFIFAYSIYINFFILIFLMVRWFRDIIIEATFEGRHTIAVQKGITLGFLLFLVSEIMFFFSFFWAFFSNALSPSIFIGGV